MAANTLGTLTLDLVAKIGGFVEPLSRAERLAKKSFDGIGASVDALGNYTDKATRELDKLASKMNESFNDIGSNLKREIALYGETSRAAKLRYDLENTSLKSLDDAQKASLINMSARLDALDDADAAFKKLVATTEQYNASISGMDREIALFRAVTNEAKVRYETEVGAYSLLTNSQKESLILRAQELDSLQKIAQAEKESEALRANFKSETSSLEKEIALYGETTRVAKTRYELEFTEKSKLDDLEKQYLLSLAAEADQLQENAALQQKLAAATAQYAAAIGGMDKEIALYNAVTNEVKVRYETELGAYAQLSSAQKESLILRAQELDALQRQSEAEKQATALKNGFSSTVANLEKEIALYGETTRAAKMRYDLENGGLQKLDNLHKQYLVDLAAEADMHQKNAAIQAQFNNLNENLQKEIALYGDVTRVAKLRYDLEKGDLKSLDAAQKQSLLGMAQRLDAMDAANEAFRAQSKSVNQLGGSFRNTRGIAQQFGWQMQDVAVQLQMGTSAFVVFSQQGSQLAAAFGPQGAIIGAIIAVAGAVAGVLFKSLIETSKAMDDMGETALSLASDMRKLDGAQQEVLRSALMYSQIDLSKKLDDQAQSIIKLKKEIDALNESNGRRITLEASVSTGLNTVVEMHKNAASAIKGFAIEAWEFQKRLFTGEMSFDLSFEIDNTEELAEAKKKLAAVETLRIKTLEDLRKVQDPSGSNETIKKLAEEVQLIGLSGRAYWDLKASQEGLSGINKQLYIDLNLLREAKEANIKADEEAKKNADEEAKKAAKEVLAIEEATRKLIVQMERENALFGETSKAAQMRYDIENGILKVAGGIDGANAKRLIELAIAQDTNKANAENKKTIEETIKKLEEEAAQLGMTTKERVKYNLASAGAKPEEIEQAMKLIDAIDEGNKKLKETEAQEKRIEEMWNRIDEAAANAWDNIFSGAKNSFDGIKSIFRKMLAEMAHDAITKPILMQVKDSLTPWIENLKKMLASSSGGGGGSGGGKGGGMFGLGSLGVWGLAAVGVAAAVSSFNKKQDEMVRKMSAEYRQSTQSIGTILGEGNKKSQSIAEAISDLSKYADDTLSVNYQMYLTLIDIREGITGVAAGFARQFGLKGIVDTTGIKTGTSTFANEDAIAGIQVADFVAKNPLFGDTFAGQAFEVIAGAGRKVLKELFKQQTKIIDTGISIVGQGLGDILSGGILEAYGYATINTKKKVFGITTKNRTKEELQNLDDVMLQQFSDVFESAGKSLEMIAPIFGKEFSNVLPKLIIDPMKLSLKDLEGEALTKEIEAFFSATLDEWAAILVSPANGQINILERYQKVGEGAFETIIRLSAETAYFTEIADKLDLRIGSLGMSAVVVTQQIAEASGGMDALSKSLSVYYKEFFTDQERAADQFDSLSKRMKELGVNVVPATRDAFKNLIQGIDLTTEAGQKQFAALIGLSGAVDQYIDSLEDEAKARDDARQKLKDAVGTAFDTFSAAVQRDMDIVNKALESSRDLANSVTGALKSMNIESSKNDLMTRRAAQAQIVSATAIAKAGGPLPSSQSLEGALSILAQPSQSLFSSFEEYARDFYSTKRNLEALEEQANSQVSIDEKNLAALQQSLDYYQEQVDLLNGIDKGVISVAEAMNRLANAFAAAGVVVQTNAVPIVQSVAPVAIAADNIGTSLNPAQAPVAQSIPEIVSMLKTFAEDMTASQYAIAKYSMDTKKMLEKWDGDGLPEERDYS